MANILVVDDKAVCREVLVTLLGYAHHTLFEASNGEEALAILKANPIHLVITDLLMPNMNGYELVQGIKTDGKFSSIPIIFYTASYLLDEAKLLAETCGVSHVLYKPSDPQLILQVVNQALGAKASLLPSAESRDLIQHAKHEKSTQLAMLESQLTSYMAKVEHLKEDIAALIAGASAVPELQKQLANISKELSDDVFHIKYISKKIIAMFTLGLDVLAEREFKKLVKLFCDRARVIVGSKYCGLGILNGNNDKLMHFTVSGLDEETAKKISAPSHRCDLFDRILNDDDVIKLNNEKVGVPQFHPEINYLLGAKLVTPTHLYGFIYFADKDSGQAFNEDDEQVVRALASELSVLYENAELYDEIQRHAVKLQIALNESEHKE